EERMTRRTTIIWAAVAAFGASLWAGVSFADNPGGTSCAADGKINGRGSTFSNAAHQQAFIPGFRANVCGGGPADIIQYNSPAAVAAGETGSGAGQRAASCRTDAFGQSDVPFFVAGLNNLDGLAGATGGCGITFAPPNPPNAAPFPNPNDADNVKIMAIPVLIGSIAVDVNCEGATGGPTATVAKGLQCTSDMVSDLLGGNITNWNDPALRANGKNAKLATCNLAVTRQVRLDKSGSTQIIKNYLKNVDGGRAGAACAPGTTWTTLAQDANNTAWPEGAGCTPLQRPATGGSAALVALCTSTAGAVCYADLADAVAGALPTPMIKAHSGLGYVAPRILKKANCDSKFGSLPADSPGFPGDGADAAVNLNPDDNWSVDNPAGIQHGDITDKGLKYPICGLSWMLVYTGLSSDVAAVKDSAIDRLSLNQRQTIYDYVSYLLGPGQGKLKSNFYAPLPLTWTKTLLKGFQRNF